MKELRSDVLVIGSGGAGMYAAIAAAQAGADVALIDKSLIGRSGATVMAQMTVAAAIGHEEPDDWRLHLEDTTAAGRGLVDEALAALLCEMAPVRILEMDDWKVGWARKGNRIVQAHAPGHSRRRCVYVDFLNTGPAVSRTLRTRLHRLDNIRRYSDIHITDIIVEDGRATGAVGLHLESGLPVHVQAGAVVIATGGLTTLYQRNSASANMGGDGYALALRAGAELVDMEFVQFFPIGHLAPRLIGMDPIMWDPFRYKLGGRLLNAEGREFMADYGAAEDGRYVAARDVATYAILKEVEAGRGSPHGGAYLSFEHVPEEELRAAFGPVIDRLAANGIDLTRRAIEVAPIAHYHMGGVHVDQRMATRVAGLYAAGEAVGGAAGANRLSGNAISEALVFGEVAGREAAGWARTTGGHGGGREAAMAAIAAILEDGEAGARDDITTPTAAIAELQQVMANQVGPFRTADGLARATARIEALRSLHASMPRGAAGAFDLQRADWLALRNMLLVAACVATAARRREESRGAHQREDFPKSDPAWLVNQFIGLADGEIQITGRDAGRPARRASAAS